MQVHRQDPVHAGGIKQVRDQLGRNIQEALAIEVAFLAIFVA